jgi:hypothetical protein
MKIKHVAFAKIGKSLKFASAYSPIGGDNEGPAVLRLLANNNPDISFYLVGRSDYNRLTDKQRIELFPYGNVVDCYTKGAAAPSAVIDFFNKQGFQPDVFIAMPGQIGTVTIPGKIQQVHNPSLTAAVIDMTKNYTTPITSWMNETSVPIVEIINDPRYTLRQSRDIIPHPTISLSQYNFKYIKNSIISYEDQRRVDHEVTAVYAEMEKIFLFDRTAPVNNRNRDVNFMVVLNEGSPSRYSMLKEWVLDKIEHVDIYGKWEHESTLNDKRFCGSLNIEDLQNKLRNVRSTFIIPIAEGWVTSKYIEMIHAGVVPFFHPTYDMQNHLSVPEFLRPKTSEELMNRIEMMKNDDTYIRTIDALQKKFCTPEYYNGAHLCQIIMKAVDPDYKLPDTSQYKKQSYESFSLENFFG